MNTSLVGLGGKTIHWHAAHTQIIYILTVKCIDCFVSHVFLFTPVWVEQWQNLFASYILISVICSRFTCSLSISWRRVLRVTFLSTYLSFNNLNSNNLSFKPQVLLLWIRAPYYSFEAIYVLRYIWDDICSVSALHFVSF